MTMLTVTAPATVDLEDLEQQTVSALADRLRDDHGCELTDSQPRPSEWGNEYQLAPTGRIIVDSHQNTLTVRLRDLAVDAHDLFVAVSSELEQQYDELSTEIG
ncbi:hypothetical protein [Mycolicibacterium brisbanense]|uniref:Methylmalonyl-CoA epimerase n=1 Tax=Mycolicibacterium brisbanense TaxID=146020 RepID=A0A124DZE8_9MYCO|nr:hypothetical protein [Mycolicibacterium brisbanense]MCV7161533.1 hypothetical protein [Mycolicibacterium brisbanense]GAS87168.1 methylmalonyl-CoA epimerase [Mycolicibacterium brisbanense]